MSMKNSVNDLELSDLYNSQISNTNNNEKDENNMEDTKLNINDLTADDLNSNVDPLNEQIIEKNENENNIDTNNEDEEFDNASESDNILFDKNNQFDEDEQFDKNTQFDENIQFNNDKEINQEEDNISYNENVVENNNQENDSKDEDNIIQQSMSDIINDITIDSNQSVINNIEKDNDAADEEEISAPRTLSLNIINKDKNKDLDQEQLKKILASAGIQINISPKKSKINDKLIYEDDDKNIASCQFDHSHKFDITTLTADEQEKVKKYGICLNCLHILEEAEKIKQSIGKVKTTTTSSRVAGQISAGQQIRNMLVQAIPNIKSEHLMNFTDKNYSLQNFKLAYPLLLDITNKDNSTIKQLKNDKKGHARYSPKIYHIDNRQFLMTNDLYDKNLEKVKNTFLNLGLIEEEE